jgi:hypothetical protein
MFGRVSLHPTRNSKTERHARARSDLATTRGVAEIKAVRSWLSTSPARSIATVIESVARHAGPASKLFGELPV